MIGRFRSRVRVDSEPGALKNAGHAYSVSIDNGVVRFQTLKVKPIAAKVRSSRVIAIGKTSKVTRIRGADGESLQRFEGSGNLQDDVELSQILHYYGSHENSLTVASMLKKLTVERQPLICGSASLFVQEILRQLGHKARVVTSLRRENFNSYDNGHTVIEVLSKNNEWFLFDPGYGGWLKQGDQFLSGLDLHNAILRDEEFQFVPVRFRNFGGFFDADGVDLGFELESKWFSREATVQWYREVFRIFGIEKSGQAGHYLFLADNSEEAEIVQTYSPVYHAVGRNDFETTYYK